MFFSTSLCATEETKGDIEMPRTHLGVIEGEADGARDLSKPASEDSPSPCVPCKMITFLSRLAARGGTIAMNVMILNILEEARRDSDSFGGEVALDAAYGLSITDIVIQSFGLCGDLLTLAAKEQIKCALTCDVMSIKFGLLGQWLPLYLAKKKLEHDSDMDDRDFNAHSDDLDSALKLAELIFIPRVLGMIPSCLWSTLPSSEDPK